VQVPVTPRGGRVGKALAEFLHLEAAGGVVLLVAAIVALILANSPAANSVEHFWETSIGLNVGSFSFTQPIEWWVNDGLMTIFFFVVGLEIKQELVVGELREPRRAALPVIAAVGGMVVPALLFVAINAGQASVSGWGIPMATDIAFAVGVLALLGRRVPPPLRLFLLTLAIVDDIGGIIVIAVVYSSGVQPAWLCAAAAGVVLAWILRRLGVPWVSAYVVVGIAVWYCAYESGIHPTIAGVVMGLIAPAVPLRDHVRVPEFTPGRASIDRRIAEAGAASRYASESIPVTARLQHALHPFSSFVIVPLFALANAGVHLGGGGLLVNPLAIGIIVGLVVGKPWGVYVASMLAVRFGIADLPTGVTRRHVLGAGAIAGIGFTVALFISALAFPGSELLDEAKLGVLVASVLAALVGWAIFRTVPLGPAELDDHADDVRFASEEADVDPTDDPPDDELSGAPA
jgi:NhaA family Na+:H+ antiporter